MKEIRVEIVHDDRETALPLGEFKDLLVAEIGSVTFTVTRAQFERKVATAVDAVIQRIRDERP